jgi:hypothetical protein
MANQTAYVVLAFTFRVLLAIVFLLLGLGIRIYDLTDLPLDFHPTRYLLDGGQPAAAIFAWMRALSIHPPTALARMNLLISFLLGIIGLGKLRAWIISLRQRSLS